MNYKYLIIGNSAAGIGAVEAIRKADPQGSLAVISDEPVHTYSRALIAFYLTGKVSKDRIYYRPLDYYQSKNVHTLLGRRAVGIAFDRRCVRLEDGEEIGYEKLLIATGGKPIRPKMEGIGLRGVHTFQSLADAEEVRERLTEIRRVLVIGGGLIGMQAAEALVELGRQVTVVELMDRVLSPVLDAAASAIIEELFASKGAVIRTKIGVAGILPDRNDPEKVGAVRLSTGEEVPADSVIVSVGVVPRVELLAGSPVEINKGIVVNSRGETNLPDVYAAGDVVESFDLITESVRPLPIWPKAYHGGWTAGLNMTGQSASNPGDIAMNASHFFGFPAVSAGIHDPQTDEFEVLSELIPEKRYYKKLVLKDNVPVGLVCLGDAVDRAGIILGLMQEKTNVGDFKHDLFARFALVSLPEGLRRQKVLGR